MNASMNQIATIVRMHEAWLKHNKPTHPQFRRYEDGLKLHREMLQRAADSGTGSKK
jgi:hypothetical protein